MKLDHLSVGHQAEITGFSTDQLPAKFFELGLIPGAKIQVRHKAPFGGTVCVCIEESDALIAIRKSEAGLIDVEKI